MTRSIIRFVVCIGGAITLLALGGFTLFGPIPNLIGIPLLLVASILYGWKFEKAFWVTLVIAIGLIIVWLGIQLYPDYATRPKMVVVYLVAIAAVLALLAWLAVSTIRRIDWEIFEKRNRQAANATARRLKGEEYVVARKLIEEKNIEPRAGEPAPPWIQFPDHPYFDGLQRFGLTSLGDEYLDKEWLPFWLDLTINQRHEYFQRYDLGDQWPDRDDWYGHWVTWEEFEDPAAYLEKLVEEATLETRPGEPAPPWSKYPELYDATSYWHQGKGGDYLQQTFLPFFNALTVQEQENYLHRHDLGLGWDDRDEWMRLINWEGTIG